MPVTVSYPGVYIEEFAPGAPIQGVGTSTAAFIGTAAKGPIRTPTFIQSWDAFKNTFGDFITEGPVSYLAPAVYGFFLNGGTACYIIRVGKSATASANLDSTQSRQRKDPALVVRARQEGLAGNNLSVVVTYPDMTPQRVSVRRTQTKITASAIADRSTLTVENNAGFVAGDRVHLKDSTGNVSDDAIVHEVKEDSTTLVVAKKLANDFVGGTLRTADLLQNQRNIRLVPEGKKLGELIPAGSTVEIKTADLTEIGTVESVQGDAIILKEGLSRTFPLEDETKVPEVWPLVFDLTIVDASGGKPEPPYEKLGMSPNHPNYWGTIRSTSVTIEKPATPPSPLPKDPRPAEGTYSLSGGTEDDRAKAWRELGTNPESCLDLLKSFDDISILCIPGAAFELDGNLDTAMQEAMVAYCDGKKNCFAILDSVQSADRDKILKQFEGVRSQDGYAALYYPWIKARNPVSGKDDLWPPSGHIAGAFARTDAEQGVHKAPANTNLRGALGLERRLTDDEQGKLNPMGINVLRVFPGQGQPLIWGARTTATNRNWQYVNIRRLFMFLEESIQEGIRWAVFEPNNLQLWQKLKRSITEFLMRVWRAGALFGATPDQAFYVRIDEALNTPDEQKIGRLNIEIGVRPTYAAEFIVVRIGIWDGGAEVSE